MVNIVIRDGRRYREYTEKNGYKRVRKLCILEKCNNNTTKEYCKRHTVSENFIICKNCIKPVKNDDSFDGCCDKCNMNKLRKQVDFSTKIVIENGIEYRIYKNAGKRKMCKLKGCNNISSGELCRFHNTNPINDDQRKCQRCLNVKSLTFFTKNFKNCDICREYKRKTSIKHHDKRRKFLLELKITKGGECSSCKTKDLEILEFDHLYDKVKEVRRISNFTSMTLEAEKCQLLCCNCHRKKSKYVKAIKETSIGYIKRKKSREHVNNIKKTSNGCCECEFFDENFLNILDFDHIYCSYKKYNISEMVSKGISTELIDNEILKTRIICANCHRKHTLRQFDYPVLKLINNLKK